MKRIILSLMSLGMFPFALAQTATDVEKQNWFHANYEETGVYGVNTKKALDFLKANNRTQKPLIVGVLDSGVDYEHEDLAANMWTNMDEVAGNGKDDDKNGFVDDMHGWSFLGGKDGKNVNSETLEVTRIYRNLKAKYENKSEEEIKSKKDKKEYALYKKTKAELEKSKEEATTQYEYYKGLNEKFKKGFADLAKDYGVNKKLSEEGLKSFTPTTELGKEVFGMVFASATPEDYTGQTMGELSQAAQESVKGGVDYFGGQLKHYYNTDFNPRAEIIKDDLSKLKDNDYGNNDVEGPDALHGTHVAGLIAAVSGNGIGMDGVGGNHIQIMSVRTVPDGDEYDKDVANSIIYAVDNGAKILNMSFGKSYSPDKKRVWKAMKYAEKKGVLMVKAAGNSNENIDEHVHFPTNFKKDFKPITKTVITVGANTRNAESLRSSFSNFGIKSVDVFAPGSEIYSTVPNNEYQYLQGTSMASPITAGVAALVWSHYPNLSAKQVKEIIEKSVNKSDALSDISKTGGVVDAYKAVQLAEKLSK